MTTKQNIANMVNSRKFVLVKHFEDMPKETDLEIKEENLPELNDGGNKYELNI